MPRVVWAEESKTSLSFEIVQPQKNASVSTVCNRWPIQLYTVCSNICCMFSHVSMVPLTNFYIGVNRYSATVPESFFIKNTGR